MKELHAWENFAVRECEKVGGHLFLLNLFYVTCLWKLQGILYSSNVEGSGAVLDVLEQCVLIFTYPLLIGLLWIYKLRDVSSSLLSSPSR